MLRCRICGAEHSILNSAHEYEYENEPLSDDPICPICLSYPIGAVKTECGHIFCEYCLFSALVRRCVCPADNLSIERSRIEDDKEVDTLLGKVIVFCPICRHSCSRAQLQSHLSSEHGDMLKEEEESVVRDPPVSQPRHSFQFEGGFVPAPEPIDFSLPGCVSFLRDLIRDWEAPSYRVQYARLFLSFLLMQVLCFTMFVSFPDDARTSIVLVVGFSWMFYLVLHRVIRILREATGTLMLFVIAVLIAGASFAAYGADWTTVARGVTPISAPSYWNYQQFYFENARIHWEFASAGPTVGDRHACVAPVFEADREIDVADSGNLWVYLWAACVRDTPCEGMALNSTAAPPAEAPCPYWDDASVASGVNFAFIEIAGWEMESFLSGQPIYHPFYPGSSDTYRHPFTYAVEAAHRDYSLNLVLDAPVIKWTPDPSNDPEYRSLLNSTRHRYLTFSLIVVFTLNTVWMIMNVKRYVRGIWCNSDENLPWHCSLYFPSLSLPRFGLSRRAREQPHVQQIQVQPMV
eukprot:Rmarinus@m.879